MQIYIDPDMDNIYFFFPYARNPELLIHFGRQFGSQDYYVSCYYYRNKNDKEDIKNNFAKIPLEDESRLIHPLSYFFRKMIVHSFTERID